MKSDGGCGGAGSEIFQRKGLIRSNSSVPKGIHYILRFFAVFIFL